MRAARSTIAAALLLAASALVAIPAGAQAPVAPRTTVGLNGRLGDVVLAGPELVAKPADRASPLVVRVVAASPHGSAFRYDFEYQAFEPGTHDLVQGLVRRDGSPVEGVAPVLVTVESVLPPGQLRPHPLGAGEQPSLGGYRAWMIAAPVLWLAGLGAILLVGRKKRARAAAAARPPTLADRLRPLVERAASGALSATERAGLEMGLIALWRRRLGIEERQPHEVLALLSAHADAGPLLRGLERWLHHPATPSAEEIGALLEPYRDLPPDLFPAAPAPRAAGAGAG